MLRCLAKYKSAYGAWNPGDVIDDPVNEAGILASSPLSFEVVQEAKAATPEVDKMVRTARTK